MDVGRQIQRYTRMCLLEAPVVGEFATRNYSTQELRQIATRHHAEVRTFIDLKLPSRMRLCPSNAIRAKEFFWTIYGEEQGRFVIERNHATVFKRFCNAIGIDDQTLEREYEGYWPNFRYLLTEPPSTTAVVRELAISYAWESAIATIADPLGATVVRLQNELEVASEDLRYFSDHLVIDESHAERALSALTTYLADDDLIRFALSSIHRTLIDENPWRLTLVAKEASSHSSSLLM